MTQSSSVSGLRASAKAGFTAKRRQAGTSLVEILVVIVIFLIGILAVVQVFPGGFRLLMTTRNNSLATALGRETAERLKANPDLIPDEILPVRYSGGVPVVESTLDPRLLSPQGDSLSQAGILTRGGANGRYWPLASGPNFARRVVGEGQRVPVPRQVGPVQSGASQFENYGGLMVLEHGPIDPGPNQNVPNVVAYANELTRTVGTPRETVPGAAVASISPDGLPVQFMAQDGSTATGTVSNCVVATTPVSVVPFEFYVADPNTSDAAIYLPSLNVARTYRLRLTAYIISNGTVHSVDFVSLSIRVPRIVGQNPTQSLPLVKVRIADVLANTTELSGGNVLAAVAPESVRVAPQYVRVSTWTTRNSLGYTGGDYTPVDPFQMKVLNKTLGVLLFSPASRNGVVERPGGVSEPLLAKVDYDVLDWRILSEDFRVTDETQAFQLALQSLKVGSLTGPDGLANGGMFDIPGTSSSPIDLSPTPRDNVVLIDLTTGFEVQRYATGAASIDTTLENIPDKELVKIDKSKGIISLQDAARDKDHPGLQVNLVTPDGQTVLANALNRTFRVLYRARNEWAVQVMKAASQYSPINSFPAPGTFLPDQYFVGNGDGGTRNFCVYFPTSEVGHKVTIDRIYYTDDAHTTEQVIEGQDFVLKVGGTGEVTSLAYADLTDVVSKNLHPKFSVVHGVAAQGVKGASVDVRVLYNPDFFSLVADPKTNLQRIDVWGRGWRSSLTQTYLRAEESR